MDTGNHGNTGTPASQRSEVPPTVVHKEDTGHFGPWMLVSRAANGQGPRWGSQYGKHKEMRQNGKGVRKGAYDQIKSRYAVLAKESTEGGGVEDNRVNIGKETEIYEMGKL